MSVISVCSFKWNSIVVALLWYSNFFLTKRGFGLVLDNYVGGRSQIEILPKMQGIVEHFNLSLGKMAVCGMVA